MQRPLWNRLATFLVWLLAAACFVYWVLKFAPGPVAPISAAVAAPSGAISVDALALARGLGGGAAPALASPASAPAAPSALQASRFVLTGVVVQKAGAGGVALIAVDGKPARPYRVGAQLIDGVMLQSVSARRAVLSAGRDSSDNLALDLPQLTTALAGNAMPSRPQIAAPTSSAVAPNPVAATASPPANPMAALGAAAQRLSRQQANRQRESEKETARDQSGAPAQ